MAKVSVIMPAYNAARTIAEAIDSVISQTFSDWDLFIIDDCSSDETPAIAARYAKSDPRIRVLRNAKNQGVSISRMTGIEAAQSPWVAFLDSDDLWRAGKLEKQFALLKTHPDAQILFSASAFIAADGSPNPYVLEAPERVTYSELLRGNVMSCSSVMVKRELMLRYPMAGDAMHEDYASWLQILKGVPCAYGINEPLLIYRLSANSKSSNRLTSAGMVYRTYRFLHYGTLRSAAMTARYAIYSIRKRSNINAHDV